MNTINTRLAVIDALGWPIGLAVFMLSQSSEIGGVHGLVLVVLTIWALRKLGWALDGYREPTNDRLVAFNPINPISWFLVGALFFLGRKEGPYSYTTTTLLVWGVAFTAMAGVIKLVN